MGYRLLKHGGDHLQMRPLNIMDAAWGVLPLRLVVGIVFTVHGGQKLFVVGVAGVARFLATVGLPAPTLAASVPTAVELLGGLALLAGFFTRAAAALLAIEMVVAILFVNIKGGFFEPRGVEFPLTLLGPAHTARESTCGRSPPLDPFARRARQ